MSNRRLGWVAVVLSTAITCFWAFWGIIENFHEGWYFESTWPNLALMFGQYLSFMLVFLALGRPTTGPCLISSLGVKTADYVAQQDNIALSSCFCQ